MLAYIVYPVYFYTMQTETQTLTVRVIDLHVGDVCCGSGAVITHRPYDSCDCPKGKINLGVKYPGDDQGYKRTWGKYTTIKIERK